MSQSKRYMKAYIGYSDLQNPSWFSRMCVNLFRISYFTWCQNCKVAGWTWKNKQCKRVIQKLKDDNTKIINRELSQHADGSGCIHYIFKMWKDHQGKSVPMLEVWAPKNELVQKDIDACHRLSEHIKMDNGEKEDTRVYLARDGERYETGELLKR